MFQLPSPIQLIPSKLFEEKGIEVWVKRDDLIHPFVSGNKLRKLQGWLALAKEKEVKTLVSFGGAYSNHLIALAFAASVYGFKSVGIVRGDEASENLVLKHCRLFGMELRFVSREEYRDKEACFNALFNNKNSHLMIPEGGAGEPGLIGFETLLQEPEMQADYYVIAAGTGTSALGIAKALRKESKSQVLAIACVKDKSLSKIENPTLTFDFEHAGKGFGKHGDDETKTTQEFLQKTGILLDPIYTAKAWKGLEDLAGKGYFAKGSKVIFVHTGGLTGWWGI